MPLRKKNRNPLAEKAREVTEVARELTDGGADSVKEFVTSAGSAVREFATTVSEAARDLLENAEKAADKTTGKKPRAKSRRGMRLTVLLGAVVAIVANDKARAAVSSALKKLRGETTTPSWTSQSASSDGGVRQEPVKTTP